MSSSSSSSAACGAAGGNKNKRKAACEGKVDEGTHSAQSGCLATASSETIKIWDTESGECTQTIRHGSYVQSLAWGGGMLLASGAWDQTIKIWDVKSGVCIKTLDFEGHDDDRSDCTAVKALAWYGTQLAAGYDDDGWIMMKMDAFVQIWDTESGMCIKKLKGHRDSVYSVAWNGKQLASGSSDKTIKIWDTESGMCIKTLGNCVCVNEVVWIGSNLLASASGENIKIWDTESAECVKSLEGHRDQVETVAWDGKQLVSGSSDHTIKFWDTESGECAETLYCTHTVTSVACDGDLLAARSGLVALYRIEEREAAEEVAEEVAEEAEPAGRRPKAARVTAKDQ